MANLELKAGDCFCTRNPMVFGRIINAVQKFHAKDNRSRYSHAGIMVGKRTSFEALWTNRKQDFFKAYQGRQVLIGRHVEMTPELFFKGWRGIEKHEGKLYAGHRLPLFLIPFLAKHLSFGLCVCAEIVIKFLCKASLAKAYKGWNPDDVADMIHNWKDWEIIFEGRLPEEKK